MLSNQYKRFVIFFKDLDLWKKLLLILAFILFVVFTIRPLKGGGDFYVFLDAAEKLFNGENIYAPPFIKGLHYFYSPLFALILKPLSYHYTTAYVFWLCLLTVLLIRVWFLIRESFEPILLNNNKMWLWGVLCFLLSFRFLMYNWIMIQMTILLIWGMMESMFLIRDKKSVKGSVLLALVMNFKIMPIVLLPYLIYRRYYKEAFYILGFSAFFLMVPMIVVGYEQNLFLLGEWWKEVNPSDSVHLIETGIRSQSLVGFIPVYIHDIPGDLPYRRNLLSLDLHTTEMITNSIRLFFVIFTLYFLGSPFKKITTKLFDYRSLAYIFLITPLIFPRQQKYAFIMCLPALAYVLYYFFLVLKIKPSVIKKFSFGVFVTVFIIGSPLIGSDIISRAYYDILDHYRLISFAMIILVIYLSLCDIEKVMKENSLLK